MAPIYNNMNILNKNSSLQPNANCKFQTKPLRNPDNLHSIFALMDDGRVKEMSNKTPGRRVWIARCDCRNLMLFELDCREQHKPEVLAFVRCDCCDHCKRPDQVLNLGNCRKKVTPHGRKRCLSVGFVVLGNGLPDCHQGERGEVVVMHKKKE